MSITANLAIGVFSIGFMAFAAAAQTAKDFKGATPLVAIPNEPPAKLVVDPPVPEQLALGRVFIQFRTENLRIMPVNAVQIRSDPGVERARIVRRMRP